MMAVKMTRIRIFISFFCVVSLSKNEPQTFRALMLERVMLREQISHTCKNQRLSELDQNQIRVVFTYFL